MSEAGRLPIALARLDRRKAKLRRHSKPFARARLETRARDLIGLPSHQLTQGGADALIDQLSVTVQIPTAQLADPSPSWVFRRRKRWQLVFRWPYRADEGPRRPRPAAAKGRRPRRA